MAQNNCMMMLGTAGARFVVAQQLRSSAGTLIRYKDTLIMLDPGPGTLVRCAKVRPKVDVTGIDAIILTHMHIDHSNDVNVMIDALTGGGIYRRGMLFAPRDCLEGPDNVVLRYLRGFLDQIVVLEARKNYFLPNLNFSTSSQHLHEVETYGIKFDLNGQKLAFMVDTKFFPGLINQYRGSDILIINVAQYAPHPNSKVMHLNIEDVKILLSEIRPKKAILTHFGMTMLKAKPWILAKQITQELGVEVIAAYDGMKFDLDH